MMRLFRKFGGLPLVALALAATPPVSAQPATARPSIDLSVLTYNIHGLPWPVASDRSDDFDRIAAQLRTMRAAGTQPHVVVLQEAFTARAKAIGAAGGYRYSATGPAADASNPMVPTAADHQFAEQASWFKGERSGKLLDSGLQILSDYPILAVRRMPFPAFACAGFDCLANKGVLMALVKVPGSASPVVVATAHFNSRHASGVADARSNYAYQRQVDAAGQFLAHSPWQQYPIIFAGDFNVGSRNPRQAYLTAAAAGWWGADRSGAVRDAMHSCHGQPGRFPAAAEESYTHNKDWQFFASTRLARLTVDAISVPFGRGIGGQMQSDHIGYTARYSLASLAAAPRIPLSGAWSAYARLK